MRLVITEVSRPAIASAAVEPRVAASSAHQPCVQSDHQAIRKGSSGISAPSEKAANEPSAARTGEPSSPGSRPSSSRASVSSAVCGLAINSLATSAASAGDSPLRR